MSKNNSNVLVDQKLAVSLFLDSLLREPEIQTREEALASEPPVTAPVTESVPEVKIQEQVVQETRIETETVSPATQEEIAVVDQAQLPAWVNEPFQILLFKVAGLKLAVPLVELSGVIEWTDSVTEMPGHAAFYLGILQHLEYKVPIIDTASMVLPKNKLHELVGDNPRERIKHIVFIDDFAWGLACDEIGEVITLQPSDVRWRTANTSRDWLAGTVIEHMCALLNGDGFSKMLRKGKSESE